MTELVLPPALRQARNSFRYIDSTGITRGVYSGITQTTSYGGDRIGATIEFTPHGGNSTAGRSQRAQLQAFLMALRSKQNRVFLTDTSYQQRGSFPAPEIFTNSDLSSTTGWNAGGSATLTAADGTLRVTLTQATTSIGAYQTITVTQYVPYVLRSLLVDGRGLSGVSAGTYLQDSGGNAASNFLTTRGYLSASGVLPTTGAAAEYPLLINASTSMVAGDYIDIKFASLSRCALADGYGNLLLQSDTIDNASWTSVGLGSVTANALAAPDGTTTADLLVQDTSSGGHYRMQNVTIPSSVADYAVSCCFHSSNRSWAFLLFEEQTGGQSAYAFFNLGAGTVGTVTSSTNMANARAFIVAKGNGWYECHLVARKTNAATVIQARVCASTADNTLTYTGSAEGSVYAWRASMSASSVPLRSAQTTSAAIAAVSQTGAAIYVKGLPASTMGLLLAGDWVEIDGQLKMITASLDSDAAGLGYLQFSPPLRRSIADNTPIIVCKPMGRFMLAADQFSTFSNDPGLLTGATLELEEAFA